MQETVCCSQPSPLLSFLNLVGLLAVSVVSSQTCAEQGGPRCVVVRIARGLCIEIGSISMVCSGGAPYAKTDGQVQTWQLKRVVF